MITVIEDKHNTVKSYLWQVWTHAGESSRHGRLLGNAETKLKALRNAFEEQGRDRKELARLMLEENKP